MRLFIFLFLSIYTLQAAAQRQCNTQYINNTFSIASQSNSLSAEKTIVIPVVVHVVFNDPTENISEVQIRSQIDALNADFSRSNTDISKVPAVFAKRAASVNIRFELAKVDPMGRPTTGIIRKKSTRMMWSDDNKIKSVANGGSTTWDATSYLNIWVCNTVPGLTGYSTFPGADQAIDGIVVRYDAFGTTGRISAPFNKGRTLTHEVGHWMGLKHLWGDQQCGDDGIEDTPKQRSGNSGDPVFPRITACNATPEGEMFMNFMDFTNDASMAMFTEGQKKVMRNHFENGAPRASLTQSKGLAEAWNANLMPEVMVVNTRELVVYPNPVQSSTMKVLVNLPYDNNGRHYAIIAANGQIVKKGHMDQLEQDVDVSSLTPGIYQIRLTDVASNIHTKFVKH